MYSSRSATIRSSLRMGRPAGRSTTTAWPSFSSWPFEWPLVWPFRPVSSSTSVAQWIEHQAGSGLGIEQSRLGGHVVTGLGHGKDVLNRRRPYQERGIG